MHRLQIKVHGDCILVNGNAHVNEMSWFGFSHYKLLKSKIAEGHFFFFEAPLPLAQGAAKPGQLLQGTACRDHWLEAAPRRDLQVCVPAAMGVPSDTAAA